MIAPALKVLVDNPADNVIAGNFACACSGTLVSRACVKESETHGLGFGCHSKTVDGGSAEACYCNTDKCNGAVMTSPIGHVIMMVALLINAIIAHLL